MRYHVAFAVAACALLGRPLAAQPPPAVVVPAPQADAAAAPSPAQTAFGLQPDPEVNREAVLAIDLLLGMETGVRSQLALFRGDRRAFVAEAFYGALVHKLGDGEGAGAGGRFLFRRDAPASCNSVILSPGFDVLYQFDRHGLLMLDPSVEMAWLHGFGDRGGWEFGLNAGVGIGVAGRARCRSAAGQVTPLISVYSGFRF
jgi:hypothetical protein